MDNLYGSIKTILTLSKVGIFSCGTFRKNKGIPDETEIDMSNATQGDYKFMMSKVNSNVSIVAGHWYDSSIVRFASSFHDGTEKVVKRRRSGHATRVEIKAPDAMHDYNIFMHGNDRADQKRRSFTVQIRAKKWWKPLFNFVFDSACINAHLLYRQMFRHDIDRKEFMIYLCKWLCNVAENKNTSPNTEWKDEEEEQNIDLLQGLCGSMIGNHVLCKNEPRSDGSMKTPSSPTRSYCFVHSHFGEKSRVSYYCQGCRKYFHLDCYFAYHHHSMIFIDENGDIKSE